MPLFRLLQHIAVKDSIAILKTTIEASFPSEVLLFLFFLSGFNILFHLWKKCISCCRHLFYMLLENVLGGQVPYQCFQISLIFVKVLNKSTNFSTSSGKRGCLPYMRKNGLHFVVVDLLVLSANKAPCVYSSQSSSFSSMVFLRVLNRSVNVRLRCCDLTPGPERTCKTHTP